MDETEDRVVRVLKFASDGAEDSVLVHHVGYACAVSKADLLERPATGAVLCPCGSAGWI